MDGDENAKAALYALTQLDGSKPTVGFFITDAGYHSSGLDSPTARAEERYLLEKGVPDTDFFQLFDSVRVCARGIYVKILLRALVHEDIGVKVLLSASLASMYGSSSFEH